MFVDRLVQKIGETGSILLAGCDPVFENLPQYLLEAAAKSATTDEEFVSRVLNRFTDVFIAGITKKVPAVKPNIAFFEQYGVPGVIAFDRFCVKAHEAGLLVIADAKRGDIGTTASAYARAFLGASKVGGRSLTGFCADAVTVNPYLGFDTLEPFISECETHGKGIYVLVQTSNPGAKDIEGLTCEGRTVSERVADWLAAQSHRLQGVCGWSGLGAVVGATYPEEARALRSRMPSCFFLIPGYGAQGGKASDAVASFTAAPNVTVAGGGSDVSVRPTSQRGGGIINASRALLAGDASDDESFVACITANATSMNADLNSAREAF
jgi:orotidine-5'-phosphate decarboxylase